MGFVMIVLMSGFLVSATNSTAPATAYVTVNGFISLSLSPGSVTFGNMAPNETKSATNNPLVVTIGSETNVDFVNITTKSNSTVLKTIDGSNNFSVSNMSWDTNVTFPNPVNYSWWEKKVYLTSAYGQNYSIYHRLTIPLGQTAGFYITGITITAKDD